jgi:hypothetical protein
MYPETRTILLHCWIPRNKVSRGECTKDAGYQLARIRARHHVPGLAISTDTSLHRCRLRRYSCGHGQIICLKGHDAVVVPFPKPVAVAV